MINRRGVITGLISFVAAPAIVRAGSLMPVKAIKPNLITLDDYYERILRPMVNAYFDFDLDSFNKDTGRFV